MEKVKTIFIGSGEFAIPILQALLSMEGIAVEVVVTQADKPAGRGSELKPTPVAKYIEENSVGVEIVKPEKLRTESADLLSKYVPDLIIVASYGQMIPDDMLNVPRLGCLNIHGSLLPILRGAVPVQMAILKGLKSTGVTIQRMVKELDEGPIYSQKETGILESDTTATLMDRLAELGAELLLESLPKIIAGEMRAIPQDDSLATYCYQSDIAKEKAEITRDTDVVTAERMIRAFNPWPVAWTKILHNGVEKRLLIFEGKSVEKVDKVSGGDRVDSEKEVIGVGQVMRSGKCLYLKLKDGFLKLLEVQLEGKERRKGSEYLFLAS